MRLHIIDCVDAMFSLSIYFQMGMGNICANTANFEGLLKLPSQSSSQPFFISKAVHSIKMNVDEVGKTGGAHTKGAICKCGQAKFGG